MSKWIKKEIVDAFKWTGDKNQTEDPQWIIDAIKNKIVWFEHEGTKEVKMIIKTKGGTYLARRGDYIVKDSKGNIYPCNPDAFESTYEQIKDINAKCELKINELEIIKKDILNSIIRNMR